MKGRLISNGLIVALIAASAVLVRVLDLSKTVFLIGALIAMVVGVTVGALWTRRHPDSDSTT